MGKCAGCRVQGAGCRVQGAGCRGRGAGCRGRGAGCRVQGAGGRVQGLLADTSDLSDLSDRPTSVFLVLVLRFFLLILYYSVVFMQPVYIKMMQKTC